ncbi:MAG: type II secretion system F family protein [Kiritimatiellales bacterium]|nr:type II secretion system F family protein [Kiritimatiellota bacterium]MBL7015926.1 type II secretion system F family protein [Kiritimatiellales bacterium]
MKTFNYTAKNAAGELVRDVIESDSRQNALSDLRRKGLTVVTLMELDAVSPQEIEEASRPKRKKRIHIEDLLNKTLTLAPNKQPQDKKVRISDMSIFCRQLAISVNSGLPLREALEGIHEDMDVRSLKAVLENLIKKLHDGIPFSQAVAAHPKVFSPIFIGMVRAAEEAGSLPETLNQLANYMEASDKLQRKIKTLLAYPAFVAVFFVIITLVMVLGIIPRFQDIFGDLDADLPTLTTAVFGINAFVVQHFPVILAVVAVLILGYVFYRKTPSGRLNISRMKLKMPLSGDCLKRYIIARICRCLAIMLKSGVPISTALQIVSKIGNNLAIENAILAAQEKIIAGSTIALGLKETEIFPALLIRMLGVGENAGQLPEVLNRVSDAYEDQVEASITTGTALLEPIIITVFGMMVLLLIISIYLPVFSIASHV